LLAENEVVNAASTTFKNDRDTVEVPEIMERMKMYLAEFRHEEATKLFPN